MVSAKAWALLGLLSFIWGASFLFIELALLAMGPVTLVFFRVLVGGLTLAIILMMRLRRLPKSFSFWFGVFVMGFLNNVLPFTLISYGQVSITGGMASIINANTAFFGVIVAAIFIADERLNWHRFLGVLIGICGVIAVVGPAELRSLNPSSLGQLAVVVATLFYALASVWGKLRLAQFRSDEIACGTLLCATIIMIPFMLVIEGVPSITISWSLIGVFTGLGVIGTGFAYLLYFQILALAGASHLMLVTIIVPVFAVVLDALFLQQFISLSDIVGFVIIAVGLMLLDGRILKKIRSKPITG